MEDQLLRLIARIESAIPDTLSAATRSATGNWTGITRDSGDNISRFNDHGDTP